MARAMNVEKRVVALQTMSARLTSYATKAEQISNDLINSFFGNTSSEAKKARRIAKVAARLSTKLIKAAESVKL